MLPFVHNNRNCVLKTGNDLRCNVVLILNILLTTKGCAIVPFSNDK